MNSSNRSARRIIRRALGAVLGPRGASTVEYAVILVAVLLLSAGAWKLLGGALGKRSSVAGDTVSGGGSGSSSGGGKGGGGGSHASGGGKGGSGGGSGGEKASAAAKVSVGGVGGAAGESGGGGSSGKPSQETSSESSGASGGGRDSGGSDVAEGFTAKRWFGIGLLAAGLLAVGYVVTSMRRAKKSADDMAKDGSGNKTAKGPAPPPPLA